MGRSVGRPVTGAGMMIQPPAVQTQLSSQQLMPHSAVTKHSGPMYPVMDISMMVRYSTMVNDVLPTNNTATTPGTLRTEKNLNQGETRDFYQLVQITPIEYLK